MSLCLFRRLPSSLIKPSNNLLRRGRIKCFGSNKGKRDSNSKACKIKKELVHFGPPKVIDKDGVPVTQLLGNGSEVVIKVVVYDSKKGKGHRLEAVQVHKLVVWEGSGDGNGSQAVTKAVAGVEAF